MRLESQKICPHLWTNSFALVLLDFETTPSGRRLNAGNCWILFFTHCVECSRKQCFERRVERWSPSRFITRILSWTTNFVPLHWSNIGIPWTNISPGAGVYRRLCTFGWVSLHTALQCVVIGERYCLFCGTTRQKSIWLRDNVHDKALFMWRHKLLYYISRT